MLHFFAERSDYEAGAWHPFIAGNPYGNRCRSDSSGNRSGRKNICFSGSGYSVRWPHVWHIQRRVGLYKRAGELHICGNNFPDEKFRNYISGLAGAEDGYFSGEECAAVTYVNVAYQGIHTLRGIELLYLDCSQISLEA